MGAAAATAVTNESKVGAGVRGAVGGAEGARVVVHPAVGTRATVLVANPRRLVTYIHKAGCVDIRSQLKPTTE